MKELKEGMYVRTKDGKIFDCYVSEQMGKPIYYPKSSKTNGYIDYEEVYKKSKCIIDLIEEGDYVDGVEVKEINDKEIMLVDTQLWIDKKVVNRLIESIVTKEQFEDIKYEVNKDE